MGNFATTGGSRVSENRQGADLNGSSEDKPKADDVNMESVNDSGPVEDYVMSEASSLLNTKQDHSRDDFEEIEEENVFHVGDFVWVQGVNRHQWWPGKVYDSSDASDLALKQMQKGTLLVAFCWKETFAWCTPSQLKPFLENFRVFSKTSESSSFHSAVREAVREIGQHVENLLVCDEEALVSPVAVNCGVKEGVLVPDVRREIVTSLVLEKPGIVLEDVKSLAKTASFSDWLEIEVLKRKLSAFYRSKGRFDLAKYDDEPQYIIGLEDREDIYALNFNNTSCHRSLRKCSGIASKKRKHGDEVNKAVPADVAATTSKIENADVKQVEDVSNGKSSSSSRKRKKNGTEKREESNNSNHLEESEKKDESGIELIVDLSTPLASLCKRVKVDDVSSSAERNNGSGETIVQTGKRERKKSKYLSPEYLTDFSWRRRKNNVNSAEKAINFVRFGGATTEEILELIRAAALSTQYSKECKSSYEMIRGFTSIYRSFTYDHGAHKRNVSDEGKQQVVDEKDLIKTYQKFGALDKERSCMLENNSCARVSFLNVSDGEKALYKSVEKCPFTTASNVTFELKSPSCGNANERKGVMEIEWLKKKLEEMRALVDESEGGEVTQELKMKLEEESRNLLDKVRKMTVGSSS